MSDAATMAAAIEETANWRHADGPRSALPSAARASSRATVTGSAFATSLSAMLSPATGVHAARPVGKGKVRRSRDADEPLDPLSFCKRNSSPSCRRYSSRRVACQYVGVILLGSPFSLTHARASADQ